MGSAAAIFLIGGSPWTQSGWTIGSELTQFDADASAIAKAVEVKVDFYCSNGAPPPPPSLIFLLTSLLSAMMAVKNLQSTKAHLFVLCFHTVLTKFFLLFSEVSVMVVWAPFDITLIGFRLVSFIAEEAAQGTPPDGFDCIQLVAFQKEWAHRITFHNWEHNFYLDHTLKGL